MTGLYSESKMAQSSGKLTGFLMDSEMELYYKFVRMSVMSRMQIYHCLD